jgi:lysophospholipid acyltransferase (LPLAT)-like uncharacterized protein
MSPGIVYLASRSGSSIVPTAFACSRSWRIPGSWTDLVIPQPFSEVVLLSGDPIKVPAGLARADLNDYVARVQAAMDSLDQLAVHTIKARSNSSPELT